MSDILNAFTVSKDKFIVILHLSFPVRSIVIVIALTWNQSPLDAKTPSNFLSLQKVAYKPLTLSSGKYYSLKRCSEVNLFYKLFSVYDLKQNVLWTSFGDQIFASGDWKRIRIETIVSTNYGEAE